MCDEYEDERMRALWRQLALQERLAQLNPEPEGPNEPEILPTVQPLERVQARLQGRVR